MQRLVRRLPLKAPGRNTQVVYQPEVNASKLNSWSTRLNKLSSTTESKISLGQLSALQQYYNKETTDTTKPIEWNEWKSRITTDGLVDKVKQSYEEQSKQQYNLDGIFNEIFNRDSKALDDINNEMSFHTAVWLDVYGDYVSFLNDLNSISSLNDYNLVELSDMFPASEPQGQALVETNCFYPGSRNDVNIYGYIAKQFSWGKKIITFYRHPSDNFNALKATKNSMGR